MYKIKFCIVLMGILCTLNTYSQTAKETVENSTYQIVYEKAVAETRSDSVYMAVCLLEVKDKQNLAKVKVRKKQNGKVVASSEESFDMNDTTTKKEKFKVEGNKVRINLGELTVDNREWEVELEDKDGKLHNLTNKLIYKKPKKN